MFGEHFISVIGNIAATRFKGVQIVSLVAQIVILPLGGKATHLLGRIRALVRWISSCSDACNHVLGAAVRTCQTGNPQIHVALHRIASSTCQVGTFGTEWALPLERPSDNDA